MSVLSNNALMNLHVARNLSVCCLADQWLQFDIGPPTLVTGIVTKGRGDGSKKHWVTKYRLSYSNDSRLWHFYKDDTEHEIKVTHEY
jgi:hypothetical protein